MRTKAITQYFPAVFLYHTIQLQGRSLVFETVNEIPLNVWYSNE